MPGSQVNPEDSLISGLKTVSAIIQRYKFEDDPDTSLKMLRKFNSDVSGILYVQISVGTMASLVPTEGMRFCSDRKSRGNWTRKPRILRSSS